MIRRLARLAVSAGVGCLDRLRAGARRLAGAPRAGRRVVLYYHAIRPAERERFARQLDLILRQARPFRIDAMPAGPPSVDEVAVTFDDGYLSVVQNALPELRRRGFGFTVFVPSGCLGQRPSWVKHPQHPFWSERVVSPEELRALAAEPLVAIGSHSVTHPNFLKLSMESAADEFRRSKADLEAVLGKPVDLFSYPHGAHDEARDRLAFETGYRRLFSIAPVCVEDAGNGGAIGRVLADPSDWGVELKLKAAGAYRWMAGVTALKRRFVRNGVAG